MSSRKRKKRSRDESSGESAATESQSSESELADDESSEEQPSEGAEEPQEQEAEEPQPAVSEISELKPRRKRKRAAEEEAPEPDPAASEVAADEAEEEEEEEDFADDSAKEAPKTRAQLKRVIESLIFVADQVITAVQLGRIAKTKVAEVREVLAELSVEYEGRGIDLIEVNGGYQFRSAAASAAYVRVLVAQKPVRLTRAQIETLALIAYRQPITRPEVDDVRGVDSGSAIKVLLDRDLIKILGRKDDAGRPLLYGTTPFFLEFFGMNTMQELPTLREFTELSDEHRELFKAKTNDIGDPSAESYVPIAPLSEEPEVDAGSEEGEAEPVIEQKANAEDDSSALASQPEPEPEPEPEPDSTATDGTDSEIENESGADGEDEIGNGTGTEIETETESEIEAENESATDPDRDA